MSLVRRYAMPRLRHGARTRVVAGWLAALALLVASLAPQLQALARPDAHDPLSSLCAGGSPVSGPAGDHPFGNACALCTLAHTAPLLGTGAPRVAVVDYVPPPPPFLAIVRTRTVAARAPSARAPPAAA